MSNETYLAVSYFVVGTACVTLGLATYALLWKSFAALTREVPGGQLGRILRRLFLLGIVLPALTGFFSVSFSTCGTESYEEITSDRSYLIARNQEQLSASMSHTGVALLVWGLIVSIGFATVGKGQQSKD